jgi:putative DNA primase/helicase
MARCPAHNDPDPSLSIRDGDNGKLLVRCHAGCDQKR